jgi:hypothetical protein
MTRADGPAHAVVKRAAVSRHATLIRRAVTVLARACETAAAVVAGLRSRYRKQHDGGAYR